LANAAYEANEHDLALKIFDGLLKDAKLESHMRIEVSIKMGNIWLGKSKFGSALGAFIQSLHQGEYGKDSTSLLAIRGVLRTFEAQGKLDSAAYFMGKLPIRGLVDTAYVAGLYIGLGQRFEKASSQIQAKSAYLRASELEANDIGARAQLALARMFRTSGSFSESNEVLITQFVNEKGRYFNADGFVVGEAFLLLAENFISVKNVAQAKAILQSVLKDSDSEDAKAKAKQLLDGLP
jgi:tetratricopeptide (TPR) repeat protein